VYAVKSDLCCTLNGDKCGFSKHRVELEHEKEVSECQLQKQSEDVSSAVDVMSRLSCEMKTLHQSLLSRSQCWLQVCSCHPCIKHTAVT